MQREQRRVRAGIQPLIDVFRQQRRRLDSAFERGKRDRQQYLAARAQGSGEVGIRFILGDARKR